MPDTRATGARRGERGEVTWVGLALLLSFAAAVWLAFAWVPVYVRRSQVAEIVRGVANAAVKNPDDAALVADLARRVRALETVEVEGPSGERVRAPLIDLSPQDVGWERDRERRTLRISFRYTLEAAYPFTGRVQPYEVEVDQVTDTTLPDWGNR